MMNEESVQAAEPEDATQQTTSEGIPEAGLNDSASGAAKPEGAAGPAGMAVDTQAPTPSGRLPLPRIATLPLSTRLLSPEGF